MTDRNQLAADLARMYHSCRNFDDFADRLLSKYAVLELLEPAGVDDSGPFWQFSNGTRMGLHIMFGHIDQPLFMSIHGFGSAASGVEFAAAVLAAVRKAEADQ